MSNDTLLPFDLPSVGRKKLTIDFAGGNQSSDGGLLLLRAAERKLGVCRRLAEAMPDRRDPERVRGYEDAIDLDRLTSTTRARRSGQQLAFWNVHHDERGFASMHIYHVMIRAKYLKYFYF